MEDFGFGEMQDMQIRLQEQYKDSGSPCVLCREGISCYGLWRNWEK